MISLHRLKILESFNCLGADCEDTCCHGWGMQLDNKHKSLYENKAPELLDAVASTDEGVLIMRRDPKTDNCVKFDNGLCAIHKKYGTDFLGDACHLYPRSIKQLGDELIMSGALSCPEYARLALLGNTGFCYEVSNFDRKPEILKNYLPEGLDSEKALSIVKSFINFAASEELTPEHILARIISITKSLENIPVNQWPEALPVYINISEGLLPTPEPDIYDPFRLISIIVALISAAPKTSRPRLDETINNMKKALHIDIDPNTFAISSDSSHIESYNQLVEKWKNEGKNHHHILWRWIESQLSAALFPFGGFGKTPLERITIIAVRFATLKLALMCHQPIDNPVIIRVTQSLARFMDHLADPAFSLAAYREAGWLNEPRLRALIGDL